MLIRESMHRKKYLADKLALPKYFGWKPIKLEMSTTWTRKTEALKYGGQFQCITVEIKERLEPRIRQSDLRPNLRPTVLPQTSTKSTSC